MEFIMGIDPGWSGGVAVIEIDSNVVFAMGFTGKTEYDIYEILESFSKKSVACYIEKVHAMPKQGVTSMFSFGHNYGFLRGCITSFRIPIHEVTPQRWQGALGCRTHGDKNVTKAKAQQLYPKVKVTHAVADALLIATYGLAMYNPKVEDLLT